MRSATSVAVGKSSCASSRRFGATSTFNWVAPVTLPPGRLRLAVRPSCTGLDCSRAGPPPTLLARGRLEEIGYSKDSVRETGHGFQGRDPAFPRGHHRSGVRRTLRGKGPDRRTV